VLAGIDLELRMANSGAGRPFRLRQIHAAAHVVDWKNISGGTMKIGDRVVNHLPPAERGIAMVFQSYALYPHMNGVQEHGLWTQGGRQDKAAIEQRIGQRRRSSRSTTCCSACRASCPAASASVSPSAGHRARTALFLFDEPLSNLDAALRVQTRLEIAKLHRQLAATIVYVTHDQVEAMTLGDKIVVMHEGISSRPARRWSCTSSRRTCSWRASSVRRR
jgi:multiple sugar transport system ATP-binding protein